MCFTHVSDKMREHLCELTRSTVLSLNIKNSSLTTDGNHGSMEYRSFHQRKSMKVMRTNNPLFWHSWTLRHILESTKCSGFTMMILPQSSFSGMILLSASQTPLPPISYWIWHDACCWSARPPGCTYFPRHSVLWSRTEILNYKSEPSSSTELCGSAGATHKLGIGIVKQQHGTSLSYIQMLLFGG